jgi:hypothetical protein
VTTIRLNDEVLEAFEAPGRGWQLDVHRRISTLIQPTLNISLSPRP